MNSNTTISPIDLEVKKRLFILRASKTDAEILIWVNFQIEQSKFYSAASSFRLWTAILAGIIN